jgi:hypothetical protein
MLALHSRISLPRAFYAVQMSEVPVLRPALAPEGPAVAQVAERIAGNVY